MKSQAGKQNSTGQVNLFSCTECKILFSGKKYCHILSFMTPKTKHEFFFPSFLLQKARKIAWENFPFLLPCSLFSLWGIWGRNCTFFIPCLFPGANYPVQSEPAVLDSSSWAKPRVSFPHPHPPLHRNLKKKIQWRLDLHFLLPCSSSSGKGQELSGKNKAW